MALFRFALAAAAVFLTSTAFADEYADNLEALYAEVWSNPETSGGYWLEMQNILDEWERVILVFGFADPGDEAACLELMEFATTTNPGRSYRCDAVR